jgi:hypothetical protein
MGQVIPLPVERIVGGTVLEVDHPAGLLRFEEFSRGEWLTLKGEPAKKGRRGYYLRPSDEWEQLASVSDIVDALSKPGLYTWHEQRGIHGGVAAERAGLLEDVKPEDYPDVIRGHGLGADDARDEGADRGHVIHGALHALSKGEDPPNPKDVPEGARPWLLGAMRAWNALSPEPILAEFPICHPALRYAGRPDLYARCRGQRTLIDWKTGKGKVYDQAHFQTRGYAESFLFGEIEPPERIVIIGIDDAGNFELVDCAVSAGDWSALVTVFNARRRANESMAAQRKAAKAALKAAA